MQVYPKTSIGMRKTTSYIFWLFLGLCGDTQITGVICVIKGKNNDAGADMGMICPKRRHHESSSFVSLSPNETYKLMDDRIPLRKLPFRIIIILSKQGRALIFRKNDRIRISIYDAVIFMKPEELNTARIYGYI